MVLISPYTKVEESFNVQALHDIVNVGVDQIEKFDHLQFPGAVKRTCLAMLFLSLPSVYLSTTAKKWAKCLTCISLALNSVIPTSIGSLSVDQMSTLFNETKIRQLIFARVAFAILTCSSIIYLRRSIQHSCSVYSKHIGIWFSFFMYPLPHIVYYSSRFLPNFLSFPFTNIAIALFISGDIARSIAVLVFTGVIFRFEVLVFVAILSFISVSGIFRRGKPILSLRAGVVVACVSGILSIFLSSRIDSYFWDVSFTVPEFESFLFNVVDGKSSEWGVESPYAYFFKYIPRMFASQFEIVLILSLVFVFLSLLNGRKLITKNSTYYRVDYVNYGVGTITTLMWTSICYIFVLSLNGHKEWRFLVYTIPIFCTVAASTFEWLLQKCTKKIGGFMIFIVTVCYFVSLLACFAFGFVSSWNYSGGDAAQRLNLILIDMYGTNDIMIKPVTVHWDVGTCMNGGSLFLQIGDNKFNRDEWLVDSSNPFSDIPKYWVIYDKTEDKELLETYVNAFDYWIQYNDEDMIPLGDGYEWILIDIIEGYSGINYEFMQQILSKPKETGVQVLHSLTTGDATWFTNFLDHMIVKEVKSKIWERSPVQHKNSQVL